jgi:NAD-dependent DNA ligase
MNKIINKIKQLSNDKLLEYFKKTDIDTLYNIKLYLDDIYYNTGDTTGFTDTQYDILNDIIKNDPKYKITTGSKIRHNDNKVSLPIYLGSMDKIKPEDSKVLTRWINKNKSSEYIIESKLDGISCLLILKNNKINLYTRGDGYEGSDISFLNQYIKNIPKKNKIDITVRGELIIKQDIFNVKYKKEYSNPRNMVSGLINSKKFNQGLLDIEFIAYEIISSDILKPSLQLSFLKENNFKIVDYEIVSNILSENLTESFLRFIIENLFLNFPDSSKINLTLLRQFEDFFYYFSR